MEEGQLIDLIALLLALCFVLKTKKHQIGDFFAHELFSDFTVCGHLMYISDVMDNETKKKHIHGEKNWNSHSQLVLRFDESFELNRASEFATRLKIIMAQIVEILFL